RRFRRTSTSLRGPEQSSPSEPGCLLRPLARHAPPTERFRAAPSPRTASPLPTGSTLMILSLWIRSLKNRLDRRSSTAAYRVSGPGLETLEDRRLPALITWINPLGGDWDQGLNWSSGSVPGLADQAVIALSGITVTHSHSKADRVASLDCAA